MVYRPFEFLNGILDFEATRKKKKGVLADFVRDRDSGGIATSLHERM